MSATISQDGGRGQNFEAMKIKVYDALIAAKTEGMTSEAIAEKLKISCKRETRQLLRAALKHGQVNHLVSAATRISGRPHKVYSISRPEQSGGLKTQAGVSGGAIDAGRVKQPVTPAATPVVKK